MSFASVDRFRFKLRTRILACTTAVLSLAMIAAFAWSVVNLRSILEARNDRFLTQKLAELTIALQEQQPGQTEDTLTAELRREIAAHANDGLFAILRHDAKVEFFPDEERTHAAQRQLEQRPNGGGTLMTLNVADAHLRVIRSRPEVANGTACTIDLGMRLDETEAALADFYRRLAFGGVAFLALALVGGIVLTRFSLRPIAHAIDVARRMNADDLSARLPSSRSGDELDQLASTINALLDRVARKHAQMIRFTSDASHELRSPLAALRATIEVALQQPRNEEGYRELLSSLGEQCQRLTDLVNTLLLLASVDAGQVAITRTQVDLASLVRESVELFQPLAEENQLTLESQIIDRLSIHGDRLRLGQLITNLLDNAIKFTNPGGVIRVTLTASNGHAELTFSDTGIGIEHSRLPHIFERFYRADESRVGTGAGLGLSICQWIVRTHQGILSATSEPNQGTIIVVQLPTLNHQTEMSSVAVAASK